jgi:hypothetical protein
MPTMRTNMSFNAQRFFDNLATVRAILRSVLRWYGNRDYSKHFTKILNPSPKSRPSCITNRFSQTIPPAPLIKGGLGGSHPQILIGYQVVRLDYASCQLHGKTDDKADGRPDRNVLIFTLPTYFEVLSCQFISKLGSVFRP